MTRTLIMTLTATMLIGAGCNKDKTTATARPGEADASAVGDDAVAGAASDEDAASANAANEEGSADANVSGENAEADASATADDDTPKKP